MTFVFNRVFLHCDIATFTYQTTSYTSVKERCAKKKCINHNGMDKENKKMSSIG